MNVINKLRGISWFGTIKLMLARGFASGLVIAIVAMLVEPGVAPQVVPLLAGWAIFSTLFVGIYYLMAKIRFPGAGLMSLLLSLLIIAGDPIVYLFNRLFPAALKVTDFKLFNFHALIVVHDPEKLQQ